MAKNKEEKTNVMRTLDQKKIPYTAHSYDPDGPIDGVSVAQILGQPPEQVFKTLVTKAASGAYYVFDIPVAENLDLEAMYANAIACNCLGDANIPCTVEDEATAIRVALKCCRGIDRDDPKIIRIQNTLHLKYIQVSRALLPDVEADPRLTLVDGPED